MSYFLLYRNEALLYSLYASFDPLINCIIKSLNARNYDRLGESSLSLIVRKCDKFRLLFIRMLVFVGPIGRGGGLCAHLIEGRAEKKLNELLWWKPFELKLEVLISMIVDVSDSLGLRVYFLYGLPFKAIKKYC